MSSSYEPLIPARVELNENGTPTSTRFGDIYYAGPVPLAQARDVFLQGNQLPQRWAGRDHFTVLETGFGLGHNFLALWQAWRDDPSRCRRLHVASVEAHPFSRTDLGALLDRLDGSPRLLAQELVRHWPILVPGIHRLEFEGGAVTLTLAFGSIARMAPQLDLRFDACFLDGFSPRLNPEMWTPRLFRQLARMASPGATLASWCSAGQVRRDLQDAGFLIERRPGFGAKRHMITGRLRPGIARRPVADVPHSVIVVGSGFAGAAAAYALAGRGQHVTVFDPALSVGTAGTHQGHRTAAMTPALSRDDDIRARLSRAGVLLGTLRWRSLSRAAQPVRSGTFQPVPAADRAGWQRALERLGLPEEWVAWVDASRASQLAGVALTSPGLWHAQGYLVRPEPLLDALLGAPGISLDTRTVAYLERNAEGRWSVHARCGEPMAQADVVVVATSWLASRLLAGVPGVQIPRRLQSLHRFAGQLSHFSAPDRVPDAVLSGDGLCMADGKTAVIGGSTYVSDTTLSIITAQGHHENRQKVADLLEIQSSQLGDPRSFADGWAGWRAAVRDRLPVIGALPSVPGLWLACGFGSRGLTWSALGAELLAARLNLEPIPLERELSRKIAP